MNYRLATGLVLALGSLLASQQAIANTTWVGSANYTNAPTATGDEASVGLFDTYDFGNGVGSIVTSSANFTPGASFTGYYQTYLTRHELAGQGINLNQLDTSGGANFSGNNNGFEITLQSTFNGVYTSNAFGMVGFNVTGGTTKVFFDTSPDYSFTGDNGFDDAGGSDGAVLLSGNISGGSGTILLGPQFGVSQLNLAGFLGTAPAGVYTPNNIGGGTALFTINLSNTAVLSGVTSVMGKSTNLYAADGSLQLTAVPVPGAAWMFLSAMMGMISVSRRKKTAV
jgi:hypothetical protein